ncbi:MAG: VanZ family protein [Ignavibacteria bacterium]
MKKFDFVKYHLPLWLMLVGIFVLSSIPSDKLPELSFTFEDKLIHIILFFVLFFCFVWSLRHQKTFATLSRHFMLASLIFTILYGLFDEFHQYFVPNRTSDIYDWFADSTGAVLAFLVLIFYLSKTRKNAYDTTI